MLYVYSINVFISITQLLRKRKLENNTLAKLLSDDDWVEPEGGGLNVKIGELENRNKIISEMFE